MKYIYRREADKPEGYFVRVSKSVGEKIPSKSFFVRDYKNMDDCLAAAKIHRNGILKEYNCMHMLYAHPAAIGMSGTIGVAYHSVIMNEGMHFSYKAIWSERTTGGPKERSVTFSIRKYGEKAAYIKACEVRFKHKGTIYINNKTLIPCLPEVDYIIL